jgi:hypothetical protein
MTNYLQALGLVEVIPLIFKHSIYRINANISISANLNAIKSFDALLRTFDLKSKGLTRRQSFQSRKRSASIGSSSKRPDLKETNEKNYRQTFAISSSILDESKGRLDIIREEKMPKMVKDCSIAPSSIPTLSGTKGNLTSISGSFVLICTSPLPQSFRA